LPPPGAPAAGAEEELPGRPAAAGHSPLLRRRKRAARGPPAARRQEARLVMCAILGRWRIGGGCGVVWE